MRWQIAFGVCVVLATVTVSASQASAGKDDNDDAGLAVLIKVRQCRLLKALLGEKDAQPPLDTPRCQKLAAKLAEIDEASKEEVSQSGVVASKLDSQSPGVSPAPSVSQKRDGGEPGEESDAALSGVKLPPALAGRPTFSPGGAVQVSATSQNSQVAIDLKTAIKAGLSGDSITYLTSSFAAPVSKTDPSSPSGFNGSLSTGDRR
jgi:hypothetical protein